MKKLLLNVLLLLMTAIGAVAQETLTVYESETNTNSYVPIYGYYVDNSGLKCEFVIPSEELDGMTNGTISAMKFYLSSQASAAWNASFQVFMKEVDYTTMSGFEGTTGATIVYSGVLNANSSTMDVNFTENYVYGGGNLLIGFYITSTGSYTSASFYGKTTDGNTAWQGYSSYSGRTFIPRTTFTYTPGAAPTCPKVNNLVADNPTSTTADITWETGGTETAWMLKWGAAGFDVETSGTLVENLAATNYSLSGLAANTLYDVYVKAKCSESEESDWRKVSFRTACGVESVPYTEGFESFDANIVPNCWDNSASTTSSASGSSSYYVWGVYSYNSNKMLRMNNYWVENGTALINSPSINMPSDGVYQLSFDYSHTASCGTFTVRISDDGGSSFTELGSYAKVGTSTSYSDPGAFTEADPISLASYAGKTIILQFSVTANYGSGAIFVDNISIDLAPSCIKPTALAYSNVAARTAVLSWTAGGEETAWQICLNNDEVNPIDVNTNPYTLSGLDPETAYNVKVRANCGGGDYSEWTNNISFTTTVACPVPTAFTYSNISNTSVTVSWTAGASEGVWNLKYKKTADDEWTEVNGLTSSSYTITGLTGATAYNVQVQADCESDGTSTWLSGSFTTAYGIPFVENFGTSIPANWAQKSGLLANVMTGTALTSGSGWNFGTGNGVFDNHARTNIYGTSCYRWLLTPVIVMDANVQLTFDLALTAYSGTMASAETDGTDDKFVVLISTNGGETWTILRQYDNAGSEYVYNNIPTAGEEVAINLSSYGSDNVIIAFYAESTTSNADNNLHIDNVKLDYIPNCVRPTGLAASNVYAREATLSWTAGGSETAWQICLNDDESNPIDATNPFALTGLEPTTTYNVKVRANCGGSDGDSEWTNNISFTTTVSCPAPKNLAVLGLTTTSATIEWEAGAFETEWNLRYKADGDGDWTVENDVTSPYTIIGLTAETDYEVQLQAVCALDDLSDWSSSVDVYTGYCQPAPTSRDGNGITSVSFGSGDDIVNNSNSTGLPATSPYYGDYANLVGAVQAGVEATVNITYYTDGGYGYSYGYGTIIWIDLNNNLIFDGDEVVYVGESDDESPTTLAATFTLPISTPTGDYRMRIAAADSYYNSYITSIAAAADANSCPTGSYTVVNDYTIRVLAAPTCVPPIALTASSIGATTATLTWTVGNDETAWQVCINGDEGNLIDVDAPTYTMENLVAATDYTVKVRSNCGSDGVSDWSNDYEFTTAICGAEDQCQITYTLTDQYNDSWNGASISVVDVATNIVIANLSVQSGASPYTGTLAVCNGREIIFVWNTGSYDSEASYEVYDVNGIEIFSGSGAMDDDVTYTVDCTIKHTITASTADLNGTITPDGENLVVDGENLSFTIVPAECYHIASVLVDGEESISNVDVNGVYTFANVTADHTIVASFALNTYEITTSVEGNGTITETSTVNCGDDKQITITPANDCYRIASVMVDGVEAITDVVDGVYTFANVTAQHVITARFEQITYSFTVNAGENGTITANDEIGNVANCGEDKSFTIAANEGYSIASVLVDDVNVTDAVIAANGVYTFTNVTEEHTIAATFSINSYNLTIHYVYADNTPAAGDYTTTVEYGATYSVASPAIDGFTADRLVIEGTMGTEDVTETVTYTANTVPTHTLTIHYVYAETNEPAADDYTATLAEGADYSVASPAIDGFTADRLVIEGTMGTEDVTETVTYTANPVPTHTLTIHYVYAETNEPAADDYTATLAEGADYSVASPAIDGFTADRLVIEGTMGTEDVTETVTYTANSVQTYTITLTVGEHGTVTATDEDDNEIAIVDGVITVNDDDDLYLVITPEENYQIGELIVDGTPVELEEEDLAGFIFPILGVSSDMAVSVTFVPVSSVEMFEVGSMMVYPNPNNGMFSIDFSNIEGDATYEIINANGAVVETRDINVMNGETMNFNHDLRPGTYFVRIINGDKVYVEQIVVE